MPVKTLQAKENQRSLIKNVCCTSIITRLLVGSVVISAAFPDLYQANFVMAR